VVAQPQRVTLDQALALAVQNHPQMRAAAAMRQGAQAGIVTARAYPNPEVNILAGNQSIRMNSSVPGLLQHYSVGQPLEWPEARRTRIEAARRGQESSEYTLAETRLAVQSAVKQTFFDVLRRQGEVQLAQENLRLIEDLRRRIQVQVEVGEAARLELTRAEAEVATARNLARSAQLRLFTARSAFRAAVSTPLSDDVEPQGELSPPALLPSMEELTAEVLSRYPSLAQAQAEVRRAESKLQSEKAQRKPQPWLRGEYEQQPDLRFYRLGVTVPLPVWNRREGPIAEAEAALLQAKAIVDLRRVELTAALERAYRQYEVAGQQVVSLREGALKEAEAALQAAEAAFRFGERGIVEVLDAQRVLRGVRGDYLNAQFDRQAALIALDQLRAREPGEKP
jgi:cobalt-zinc-cadmium efflux system outer membrane protein